LKKLLGILLVAAVAAATSAPARGADAGDKGAIERLSADFAAGWNGHDAKKMAAVWAEDGDLINPFGQRAQGRAGIEKFFEAEQAGPMKGTAYRVESATVRELDPACAILDWESVVTGIKDASGKAQPPFTHHVFCVCVKKGGRWHAAAVRAFAFAPVPGAAAK